MISAPRRYRTPDTDATVIYAAVGKAVSAWELLEIHLASLYSVFVGKTDDLDVIVNYGKEAFTFSARMLRLSDAAHDFFRRKCSQDFEAEFDTLIAETRALATYRHQIAHGVVYMIPFTEVINGVQPPLRNGYMLAPPWYSFHHLTKPNHELYSYTSVCLCEFAGRFTNCANKVRVLCNSLDASWKGPARFGEQYLLQGNPRYQDLS